MPSISDHNQMHGKLERQECGNITWLKKVSRSEKILYSLIISFLLLIIVMVVTLSVFAHLYKNTKDSKETNRIPTNNDNFISSENILSNVCLTPGCVKAAAALLSSLDENIDPCSDFYRFTCGEWLKTNAISEDRSSAEVYYETLDRTQMQLRSLLESNLDGTEPSFIASVKELYKSCMNLESIEKAGSEPLRNILTSLGGWPVVEGRKWVKEKFDWIETLTTLRKLGCNHNIILGSSVVVDSKNNSRNIIKIDQSPYGIHQTYLRNGLNDPATAAYYNLMVGAATHLGAREATAKKEMLKVLQFEITLANYSVPHEETRNISKTYKIYTIKELQIMIDQVPWLKYINGLLNNDVEENETLIFSKPESVKRDVHIVTKTDKRVVANYIMWRVIVNSLSLLSEDWRKMNLKYNKALHGKNQEEPRWKICLEKVSCNMLIALSSYYVRHYFSDKTKKQVSELVNYVRNEFLRILDEIDWMDVKTKMHAIAKANNMNFSIGCPEELFNDTLVMEHYQNLTISNDSYFTNILRLNKWSTDSTFSMLRKPNTRSRWEWYASSALVNAFYFRLYNFVVIPAAYLQNPYFNEDRPNYMNFAAIGTTIGHEITHGFDDQGRQYDKDGNNVNWWAKTTDERFKKKARCIIDQYSNYTAENGMKVNGVNTQGENIADNGAHKESYWAYQAWVKDNGPEQLLPGLKYNQNQLFWISAAYTSCSKYRPEYLKRFLLSFYHSPDEFRVIGPLSNLAEFSIDFNCPVGSPMNRKRKCQVW